MSRSGGGGEAQKLRNSDEEACWTVIYESVTEVTSWAMAETLAVQFQSRKNQVRSAQFLRFGY